YHAALVADSATGIENLYLDDQLVGSATGAPSDFAANFNQIGAGYWQGDPSSDGNGWSGFKGAIDEGRIWSVARSADELRTNARRALSGSGPGLELYYRFDESQGSTAIDTSLHHRDGNLDEVVALCCSSGPRWISAQNIDLTDHVRLSNWGYPYW